MMARLIMAAVTAIGAQASAATLGSASPAPMCVGTSKFAKFDDASGFSNEAMREGATIKVYREISSSALDWVAHDTYAFDSKTGLRVQFARSIILASGLFTYVRIVDASGAIADNKASFPEHLDFPDLPSLAALPEFCKLVPVKARR